MEYFRLCGFAPFQSETPEELKQLISKGKYSFPEPEWTDVSKEGVNFY
jgi:hypothetical protein